MNLAIHWIGSLRTARQSIEAAEKASLEIGQRLYRRLDGAHEQRQFRAEFDALLQAMQEALRSADSSISEVDNSMIRAVLSWHGGRHLTKDQFHFLMAINFKSHTNKSVGLAELEDYEVFEHFCYEDEHQYGYIAPEIEPTSTADDRSEDLLLNQRGSIKARPGPQLAPEEIFWDRLRPEQRMFFESHLPKVAIRFKRAPQESSPSE